MSAPSSPPPSTRAGLAGADTWASIAYDVDGPSLEFVRPPFNLDLPLTDAELVGMADGIFPAQVEAAIAAATMPPARPLTEADWATLAGIARAALRVAAPDIPQPDASSESTGRDCGPVERRDGASAPATVPRTVAPSSAPAPRVEDDRDFKVILEFAARGEGPRQVVISVGGDGRSESFRRCDVDDWRDALSDEAPQAVEAFFARCRERPVHPPFRPAPAPGAASSKQHGAGAAKGRPGRRGKGGDSPTSPLLVFTPASVDPDHGAPRPANSEAELLPVPPPTVAGSEAPGMTDDGAIKTPDDGDKPMQQQLSFLFG